MARGTLPSPAFNCFTFLQRFILYYFNLCFVILFLGFSITVFLHEVVLLISAHAVSKYVVCTTSCLHPPSYVANFCSPTECDATVHTSISSAIVYDEDLTIGVLAPWNFALCLAATLIRHERELFKAPSSITNDITFVPASSCPATNETACEWMRMSVCRTDVRWLLHFYRAVASAT